MTLKVHKRIRKELQPSQYILDEPLKYAVETAIALDQPLLITGEPGTGKTRLADKIADLLHQNEEGYNFQPQPLVFNTKTTSTARDLFYSYDALNHFQAANLKQEEVDKKPVTANFIELQALGKAIAFTLPEINNFQSNFSTELPDQPQSAVVLIDEIDKAPRDFTNDLLNEIDKLEFQIKEQNLKVKAAINEAEGKPKTRIVVIITSNSEKNLPDAFLRRCVFYHIAFPDQKKLYEIVRSQILDPEQESDKKRKKELESLIKELVAFFEKIRKVANRKPPATAELIGWLKMLELNGIFSQKADNWKTMAINNLQILLKTKEDIDAVEDLLKKTEKEQ